ncbi:hypothetical protein [Haliangium ochraceum]|uniref:Uncharacterized protein n=1 Tax=Haliangium ochraceum (strain DSM 14365 / JCM 11303 / SMP-2) TaxID=502025 RepID=D0LFY2_HALO1|nr:hypothetical protein [Haliangium ochraceum]ACY14584.1 hypothetical protein Hoch_2039 [Haliangium ochraceum DSM 14365]
MNARRLLRWGDLEDARRRRARRGLGRLSPWLLALLLGLLLAAEVARRVGALGAAAAGDASLAGASKLVLLIMVAAQTLVICGAPFRLYWRHDAPVLGRLAIAGRALYAAGVVRSARAAGQMLVVTAAAALPLALAPAGPTLLARHLAVAVAGALLGALLAPAAALLAGVMVSSDKVEAALSGFGTELQGPRSSWLGVLPGVVGAGWILLVLALGGWARGEAAGTVAGPPALLLAVAAGASLVAALAAYRRADASMAEALREVVALDRERLAHVDLVGPSPIERAIAARLGADGAAVVFGKDTRLLRRRFPIPFFLGVVGLLALVAIAVWPPEDALLWAALIAAGLSAYGVVIARRLLAPPTEHARFLRTLPVGGRAARRAKRARVVSWTLCYLLPGAAAVAWRTPQPLSAALVLGGIAGLGLVLGWAASAADEQGAAFSPRGSEQPR